MTEPDQAENQRDRNADEQNAQQAAHRFVLEILQDEFAGQSVRPPGGGGLGSLRICNLVPSGCSSTNLSSDSPLLMSILTTSRTTPYSSCGRLISTCFGKGTLS